MRIGPLVLVAIMVACARTGSEEPTRTPTPSPASPQPTAETTPKNGSMTLTGQLNADAVEGGCAYLQAADGTKYEVIYPDGWKVSASPLQLRNPAGEVVATGGDTVTVRGEVTTEMASICMIGPIFAASEVVSITRR